MTGLANETDYRTLLHLPVEREGVLKGVMAKFFSTVFDEEHFVHVRQPFASPSGSSAESLCQRYWLHRQPFA